MQIASVLFLFFIISHVVIAVSFFLFVGVDGNCVRVLVSFFIVTDYNIRFKSGSKIE